MTRLDYTPLENVNVFLLALFPVDRHEWNEICKSINRTKNHDRHAKKGWKESLKILAPHINCCRNFLTFRAACGLNDNMESMKLGRFILNRFLSMQSGIWEMCSDKVGLIPVGKWSLLRYFNGVKFCLSIEDQRRVGSLLNLFRMLNQLK